MDYATHMDKWISSNKGDVRTSTSTVYAMLIDLGDEIKKNMTAQMSDSLRKFQQKYPAVTSADLQTFVLGYQAALNTLNP